jgi:hypothetical protein
LCFTLSYNWEIKFWPEKSLGMKNQETNKYFFILKTETNSSSIPESRIYFEIKEAESHEGDDSGDDEFGQVIVEEDVVQVESQICWKDSNKSLVDDFCCVGFFIEPKIIRLKKPY